MSKRSTAKWLGLAILGIFFLLIAAFITLLVISGNRMRAEMAKAGAKGHVLTVDDLANIKVPDADNAVTLYNHAIKLVTAPAAANDKRVIEDFSMPRERAANPRWWDDARTALKRQQPVMDLVHQAVMRPKCWFPVDWKSGPDALFPHLSHMRYFARLFAADALIKARDGDMDGSFESTGYIFKLSDSLKDGPTLIDQLVRYAIIGIGSESLKGSLRYQKPNEQQAKRMYDLLEKIDLYPGYVRTMEGERAMGVVAFDMAVKNPDSMYLMGYSPGVREKLIGRAWRAVAPMDKAYYISYMGKQIEAARYPYREAVAKNMLPSDSEIPRYAILTQMLCPWFSRVSISRDAKTAMICGDQIFLALHVYKQRYGSYPANLDQLRKRIGWKLEKDPLTGKDLIYKLKNGEFILYSIGQNLKDDGGVPGGSGSSSADDIVWKSKPDPIVPAPKFPPPPAPAPAPMPMP